MDTSDSAIQFDADGVCDHCRSFKCDVAPHWHPDDKGKAIFRGMVEKSASLASQSHLIRSSA
jgi:hypothetical protein